MTYPGSGGQWQPQQPPQYPQQQYPQQPGWQQGPPPGQQPPPGYQPPAQFGANPPPPQDPGGFPQPGAPEPPKRKRTGLIIGVIVAVVVAAGGITAGIWALNSSNNVAAGAANPTEAATNLVNSVGNGDVAGMLTSLTPGEAELANDMMNDTVDELKRLEVLSDQADPSNVSGIELKSENLKFDESAEEKVNDRVTITKLVDGKLTVSADLSQIPLAEGFMQQVAPEGLPTGQQTQTIDIGQQVRSSGEPIRIATVQTDDEWHPSLFYTVADYALTEQGMSWPKDQIAPKGADSPEQAVEEVVKAAGSADVQRIIELLPPDEMAVLHDVGPLLLDAIGSGPAGPQLDVNALETSTEEVTGGTKVIVTSFDGTVNGQQIQARHAGDCIEINMPGQQGKMCGDDLAAEIQQDETLPPQVADTLSQVFGKLMSEGMGVVTTEVDGKHYLSPMRSMGESVLTLLRAFEPADIRELITAVN
ncbi:hypothetical protein EV191_107109 [Tamaricihabitans halophyticus]|uniref:Flagellar basal body-associated protein FliL n=1 Tax=Tamaricihabitans halophyticus TaxID=1262583 RepID=A0A4R2QUS8_9PSEU|nr:flagellar basal body protein FliL [Tamaricihabitans halophyticus]TCP50845.1 hypothetical protein EV191_107109 [Tamaricihabitans halophyticus]